LLFVVGDRIFAKFGVRLTRGDNRASDNRDHSS
jgi:hypothetical protein